MIYFVDNEEVVGEYSKGDNRNSIKITPEVPLFYGKCFGVDCPKYLPVSL